jgi:hypothetical protein
MEDRHVAPTREAALLSRMERRPRSTREQRPDPRDDADAGYREAYGRRPYGQRLRAAFYQYLPEAPRGRYVGRDDAARYLMEIERVIDMQQWTAREQETLRQLKVKWKARADGKDVRFLALGVQGGINEKHRPKGVADIIANIYKAIAESRALLDGTRPDNPNTRYITDPKWPLGRPNPHRRSV